MSNPSENSLMKKTKKELIDIILRKDDVERDLRKEKADIELDFNKAKEIISKKDNKITDLTKQVEQFKSAADDLVTDGASADANRQYFEHKYNVAKVWAIILGIVAVCGILAAIF